MTRARYVSRKVGRDGRIAYTADENAVWAELYARQNALVQGRACDEFLQGLQLLRIPPDHVPQLKEISAPLQRATGWSVVPVPALIPFSRFCGLLAKRQFPAATFLRRRQDLDYLQEPDIFHEVYGHTPLLTNPWFADFTEAYGRLGLSAGPEAEPFLARLHWFTVEFGLVQQHGGRRIYGGGILSSIRETTTALDSSRAEHRPFDLIEVLRTPYRIDIVQPRYFVIEDFRQLQALRQVDLIEEIRRVRALGLLPAPFETESAAGESPRRAA